MKRVLIGLLCLCMFYTSAGFAEEASQKDYIESLLNLSNNQEQTWTYNASADAWVMGIVSAVAYPELPDQQGVSVCVPGAYVIGIDTDGDSIADLTAADASEAIHGGLVIDYTASMTSTNGQIYTAATAPVILTTGAAGYASQSNAPASTSYAADGYIAVSCGNRGKQDSAVDASGNTYYTGDAPSCLADQKAAARFIKYNILLGNLPGSVNHFVSTGGSGGAAHAVMFAATSNHPDFYDYQIEAGAVGVYRNADGSYCTTVNINGEEVALSDGAWGSIAYSAISPLYEADAAQAFEYYMDTTYDFSTPFQQQLAAYLSEAYMAYINAQNLTVEESLAGFDLNGDGDLEDTIPLTIEYDPEQYPETNGYHGTYLDLYLAEFTQNLQWYLDNLDYADGWTWFDAEGNPLSDEAVAAMTSSDKAVAFVEGRYTQGSSGKGGMMGGGKPDGNRPDGVPGNPPDGRPGNMMGDKPDGSIMGGGPGDLPDGLDGAGDDAEARFGDGIRNGGPMMGSTASAGSGMDSANYVSFDEMAAAYAADIAEIEAGDGYGKNIVNLYNPLNYIGDEATDAPAWAKIIMGAVEGDMSMFSSMNLWVNWLNAGVDAELAWQWNGGHVPSEVLGESFSLTVDRMYAKHAGGASVVKPAAAKQTANGTATEPTGTDLSAWVDDSDPERVAVTLTDILVYRNSGATKAVPGFDVIDHGQENYVFGDSDSDARHWDVFLNDIFQNEEYAEVLRNLFIGSSTQAN